MAPSLRLYNTLTRTKEAFRPLDPANVRLYACGPTVYDDAHIGNARPIIVFDFLFRLLRHLYGPDHVTYVRNITDVDDKINARAAERGISIRELTEGTARRFHDDIAALGVLPPNVEPRATEHIDEMKTLIERLVGSGHAYVAEEHVLFDVPSMPDYGALSKRPLDEMEAGARVDVAPYKRSPLDFVLWKPSKPGDPAWPSPAGIATPGRPGWHIECSAMAWKHLGETFDIHAGGIDLVFPHHENEVAQSRCCFGTKTMANYWLHNGFLQVEGEKMAKSAGNFVTIRELLQHGHVRRALMARRGAAPGDASHALPPADRLDGAGAGGGGADARRLDVRSRVYGRPERSPLRMRLLVPLLPTTSTRLRAISRVHELHALDRRGELAAPAEAQIRASGLGEGYSGLSATAEQQDMANRACSACKFWLSRLLNRPATVGAATLIAVRRDARAAKNWAESDRIRDELAAMGIALKDNKDGTTTWEPAR